MDSLPIYLQYWVRYKKTAVMHTVQDRGPWQLAAEGAYCIFPGVVF